MKNEAGHKLFFSRTFDFLELHMPVRLGRSRETIESYRDALSMFRKFIAEELGFSVSNFRFAQCSRDCVFDFLSYLKRRGNTPGTCNQRLAALKSYLWFASDEDVSLQSIALQVSSVPQLRTQKAKREALSDDCLKAIFAQPPRSLMGIRDLTLMVLLYDSAARISEILGIRLADINLDASNPCCRVIGKGSKERVLFLSPSAVNHLSRYLTLFHAKGQASTEYLFYTNIKGKCDKMSIGNVERFIQKYADLARQECPSMPRRVYPHMFRRTKATNMYQGGIELALVSRILGHSSLESTKIYAKPSDKMLRDAITSTETPSQQVEHPLWVGKEEELARLCGLR